MATTGVWKLLASEPMPDDSIVEVPSLVVPLLLKTKEIVTNQDAVIQLDDDVQIFGEQRGNVKSVDNYVKASYVAALTKRSNQDAILALDNYYQSSAGHLLLGIGLRRVLERNLEGTVRKLSYRVKKNPDDSAKLVEDLESAKKELSVCQESNTPFRYSSKFKCPHCRFSTEFKVVLEGHLEFPHVNHRKEYQCNWCDVKSKSADQIVAHFLHAHKRRCRVEKPLPVHLCRFCPYETNSKRLISSHIISCANVFPTDNFQGPQDYGENDFPGVTSKPITQEDIKAYERTRNALLLSSYNPHQINVSGLNEHGERRRVMIVPSRYSPQNLNHAACLTKPVIIDSTIHCNPLQQFANSRQNNLLREGVSNKSRLMQLLAKQNQLPSNSLSVLQYPRIQSSFMNGKSALITAAGVIMAPNQHDSEKSGRVPEISNDSNQEQGDGDCFNEQSPSGNGHRDSAGSGGGPRGNRSSTSKKSTFIICEICDSYTRDLSDLQFHMVSIHEMKMQQKTLERRPPLSCQKCKWRFFTDQGLERHLLGVHSLVTSNVQSQVEQGKDSGRCTVCGRAFANKLVAHMKDVHKANLKLAHLSYKCTICSATFNLYSLFENHVHSVHPESAKRVTSVE